MARLLFSAAGLNATCWPASRVERSIPVLLRRFGAHWVGCAVTRVAWARMLRRSAAQHSTCAACAARRRRRVKAAEGELRDKVGYAACVACLQAAV